MIKHSNTTMERNCTTQNWNSINVRDVTLQSMYVCPMGNHVATVSQETLEGCQLSQQERRRQMLNKILDDAIQILNNLDRESFLTSSEESFALR
jgi:hypothetical protein